MLLRRDQVGVTSINYGLHSRVHRFTRHTASTCTVVLCILSQILLDIYILYIYIWPSSVEIED